MRRRVNQVNRKVIGSRFGSWIGQYNVVSLEKTLDAQTPITGSSNLPVVVAQFD